MKDFTGAQRYHLVFIGEKASLNLRNSRQGGASRWRRDLNPRTVLAVSGFQGDSGRLLYAKIPQAGNSTHRRFFHQRNATKTCRAALDKDVKLTRDYVPGWKFAKDGASR